MKPTIVLVHGPFAESSSWDVVVDPLQKAGHTVIAAAHSYGRAVISNVAADAGEIIGLVYLNGLAPDAGESCNSLAGLFPGSTLGGALLPIPRGDGTTDLYIAEDRFHEQFCADVPAPQTERMAVRQRPVTVEALEEPSGDRALWKEVPSWFLVGGRDRIVPAALQRYMAMRADAHRAIELPYASHAIAVSAPDTTRNLILQAASAALAMAA
jgi:pimeloyl-ACP methyl ester carboxylesterase